VTDATTMTDTATSQSEPSTDAPAAETATQTESAASEAPVDTGEASVLGGEVAEEVAAAADDAPAGAPEAYELALEGFEIDAELAGEADPVFRELGLTNAQANALLPLVPKVMERAQNAAVQAMLDAGAQQRKAWLDAFNADPEIGGAQADETKHLAAKGLDALGYTADHPFRKALTESGFGNHPDMIRMARRMGEMLGEDGTFARAGAGEDKPDPLAELYPNNRRSKS